MRSTPRKRLGRWNAAQRLPHRRRQPDTVELVECTAPARASATAWKRRRWRRSIRNRADRRRGALWDRSSRRSAIPKRRRASAGVIKAALALHHKVLPPTIKVDKPLDALQGGRTPFYVNTEKRPWLSSPDHPRRAGVSAFGFGGSNFHCVLEESDSEMSEIDWDSDVQLLAFSGDSAKALDDQLAAWPSDMAWEELRYCAAETRAAWRADAACRLVLPVLRDART